MTPASRSRKASRGAAACAPRHSLEGAGAGRVAPPPPARRAGRARPQDPGGGAAPERPGILQSTEEVDGMQRGPAQIALVVREGVLHKRD